MTNNAHTPAGVAYAAGKKKCKATTVAGGACLAHPMRGSDFCYRHNPKNKKQREASDLKGGLARVKSWVPTSLPPETEPITLETAADVRVLLSQTVNHVRTGELDVKVGNAIGFLSTCLLKTIEQGELADRLERIEDMLEGGWSNEAKSVS